jgi:uncharacterized membrane protein (DUF4010 family)
MTESLKLLKGKFVVTVLALFVVFALGLATRMDGMQCGLAIAAIVGGFLHFDTKDKP